MVMALLVGLSFQLAWRKHFLEGEVYRAPQAATLRRKIGVPLSRLARAGAPEERGDSQTSSAPRTVGHAFKDRGYHRGIFLGRPL